MVFVTVEMTRLHRPRGAPMFKTLALVLAGASLSFIGNLSAAPARGDARQPVHNYMSERSNPANTNGF